MDEHQREQVYPRAVAERQSARIPEKTETGQAQVPNNSGRLVRATIFVTPDYLAIGSQSDFIRMPMNYHTASRVASQFGFILPTRRMVDAIYNQSEDHFTPQPLPPGPQMRSTAYYQRHNRKDPATAALA